MKRIFSLFTLAVISIAAMYAQETFKAYAELLGVEKGLFSRKVTIRVDFGQNVSFWKQGDMVLVDDNGKDIVFNSMVDAMNFMGKCGWNFEQAYVVTMGNENVYHWLLSKNVQSEEDIKAGIRVKADTKGANYSMCATLTFVKKKTLASSWDVVKTEYRCDLTNDELKELINEWKSQSTETTIYDVQVKKEK